MSSRGKVRASGIEKEVFGDYYNSIVSILNLESGKWPFFFLIRKEIELVLGWYNNNKCQYHA